MLRPLLTLAGVSAAVLAGASPAQALTFTINGTYTLGSNQSISGYFNWDGINFTGGQVNLGAVPNSTGTQQNSWSGSPRYIVADNWLIWEGTGAGADSIRLNLAAPLPTTTPLDPYASVTISSFSYCGSNSDNQAATFNNGGNSCQSGSLSAPFTLTGGIAKAPSPVSALLLIPFGSLLMLRRRVLGPLLKS